MTARDQVVTLLEAALNQAPLSLGVNVMPYSRDVETISKDTVMVRIDEVRPSTLPQCQRLYNFSLIVMVPQTTPGIADALLDELLENVLFALEGSAVPNSVVWEVATRATYEEKFPAYQVVLSVHFSD